MVPIGSPHRKNAEILINYYFQPEVAAEVAAYVNYICPVVGAKEEMVKLDPELAKNTSIFPDEATLKNVHVFRSLTAAEETDFTTQFQKALGVSTAPHMSMSRSPSTPARGVPRTPATGTVSAAAHRPDQGGSLPRSGPRRRRLWSCRSHAVRPRPDAALGSGSGHGEGRSADQCMSAAT